MIERFAGGIKVIGMVMSIILDQRLDSHSEIPRSNPRIDALLHQPCCCRVPQDVWRYLAMRGRQISVENGGIERLCKPLYRAPLILDDKAARYT